MRSKLLLPALLAFAMVLAGCDQLSSPDVSDSITIGLVGLPAGLEGRVTLTGPNGFEETVTETTRLEDLAPGTYTATAHSAHFRDSTFDPDKVTTTLELAEGGSAGAYFRYAPHRELSLAVLEDLNRYRDNVGLPHVTLDAEGSLPNWLHARYLVENLEHGHEEDPGKPWYSPEGHEAGRASNVATNSRLHEDPTELMAGLAQAPFHLLNLLDPTTHAVRHGSYAAVVTHTSPTGYTYTSTRASATLQPIRTGTWPTAQRVYFPGDGSKIHLLEHLGEWPAPSKMCPPHYHENEEGYRRVNGLPLFVARGRGNLPNIQTTRITDGSGAHIEHCLVDPIEHPYEEPDTALRAQNSLNAYGATVLLPLDPLEPLTTYTVSITHMDGNVESWTFDTDAVEYRYGPRPVATR